MLGIELARDGFASIGGRKKTPKSLDHGHETFAVMIPMCVETKLCTTQSTNCTLQRTTSCVQARRCVLRATCDELPLPSSTLLLRRFVHNIISANILATTITHSFEILHALCLFQ